MAIFNIFKRNNKNAKSRPIDLRDFFPSSASTFSVDGVSFACIDRISTEFAKLGYGVYDKRTKQKVKKNPLYELISQPNLEEDRFLFFYNCSVDYFNGGVFLRVIKNIDGTPISIFRLNPPEVNITRDAQTNRRIFNYNGYRYTDSDLIYIPARYNYSTLKGGMSIYDVARDTFDNAHKLEKFTNASFANGVNGYRLMVDISEAYPDATPSQIEELKALMTAQYAGVENASKPLFKKKGIEYSELGKGIENRAAELAENRQLQKADVAMLFGVPVELLSQDSKSVDVEKAFLMLNEFAVQPLAIQFEQAFNKILDDDRYYFEFDFNNILKVALNSRIDAYIKQIQTGLLTPNEARAKENLSPIEAGDNCFIPANLMPLNDDTINAYMAKQKLALQQAENKDNPSDDDSDVDISGSDTSTDEGVLNSQHSPAGDDKN